MSNRNVFFSLSSFVNEYLGDALKRHGLLEVDGPDAVMTLSNGHCLIYLENIDNNYVRFDFASSASPEIQFSLPDFLDAIMEGGAAKHRPKPSEDLSDEGKFRQYLTSYATLLNGGVMNDPLLGDFSWESKYREYMAENDRLTSVLLDLSDAHHPEEKAIWRKLMDGDPSWMDDVKRIIAEQESKS